MGERSPGASGRSRCVRRDRRVAGANRASAPVEATGQAGRASGWSRVRGRSQSTPYEGHGAGGVRVRPDPKSERNTGGEGVGGPADEAPGGHGLLAFTGAEAPLGRAVFARALLAIWAHVNVHGLIRRTLMGTRSPSPTFGCTQYGTTLNVGTRLGWI